MNLAKMRYKDDFPIRTINKIRTVLGELGLLTIETSWKNSVEGFYSVSIVIQGTDLMTNGKGATAQYALASAYGEMMERLQNFCNFRLSLDLSSEALACHNFFYAPDEVVLSLDEVQASSEDWLTWQLSRLSPDIDKRTLLKLWQQVSYEDIPGDFIALPYFNLTTKRISHIPVKMASKMYMSNGMCAGNTPQEALVQGISEVLERHVNKKVIREKVVPPSIPRDYIARYSRLDMMIKGIEASGNFEIIMKDCSLGEGLPVVGAIFINRSDQSYFVKFGAHPIFEIAAERTLTELLQGQEVRRMMGVREFCCRNVEFLNPENVISILVNGSGVYPTEFFTNQYSYSFSEFSQPGETTNRDMLTNFIQTLGAKGYDIYARDVSFLGFPSYHVIIPGLSEIDEFGDVREITDYINYNQIRRLIRNFAAVQRQDADAIIGFLRKMKYNPDASVIDMLNLPVKNNTFPWYYSNIDLFITALYVWQGDFVNAYEAFNKYLVEHEAEARSSGAITYYKCVRDYIGAQIEGLSEVDICELLGTFYPPDTVSGVLNEFGRREDILRYQGQLNCWHCKECPFRHSCLYPATERVYLLLKTRYAANAPDQARLSALYQANDAGVC